MSNYKYTLHDVTLWWVKIVTLYSSYSDTNKRLYIKEDSYYIKFHVFLSECHQLGKRKTLSLPPTFD